MKQKRLENMNIENTGMHMSRHRSFSTDQHKRRMVAHAAQTPEKHALDSLNNAKQKRKCQQVVKVYEKEQDRKKN